MTVTRADAFEPGELHRRILAALAGGNALFLRGIAERLTAGPEDQTQAGTPDEGELTQALWDLVWAGYLTNDTLGPLRGLLAGGRGAHRARRTATRQRYGRPGRAMLAARGAPASASGRWSLLPEPAQDLTRRAAHLAEVLLDRYGVVTRGSVVAEHASGGFAAAYRVLSAFEETGRCRRGYLVEGLGAAQFAVPGAVDRLRAQTSDRRERSPAVVLAATDPANAYGAALSWPERAGADGHRPGRKAGALVVLVDGQLAVYVERGGRTLLSFTDDAAVIQPAVDALALAVRAGQLGKLQVERADGASVLSSPLGVALEAAGFHATPRGLRLRA